MNPLETYLAELRDIRSTGAGVNETSYYHALTNLLNEIGKTLKPKVHCIPTLANLGAGNPDFGLFTQEQIQKSGDPQPGQIPSRGVIEAKPTKDDTWVTAEGKQVSKYWGRYRLILVTNYRDFLLVGQSADGEPVKMESYRLADSEPAFWAQAAQPRKMAESHGERFIEFLKRVMLHAAPLASPEDVAWFLASYARDAKARIEGSDLPALTGVREALEESLGLKFEGEKGDHFFRSSLVQTLFYGIFSAWVLWNREKPLRKDRFDWKTASYYLRVPMIQALFEQVSAPTKLKPLGLYEVLDWTVAVLNRVDRRAFFETFEEDHAVQYFYEPFLKAFDPELRKDLGVWFTPPEIVQYMVARVDTVLRTELDIEDGLADPRVYVLDPCCGTGAYLVEVLKRVAETLKQKGGDELLGYELKRAAMERVFGFEILPAPFVVSHLQLGLALQKYGAPLSEKKNERVGVYLTNALTGWDPPKGPKQHLIWPEMEAERDAAEHVKRDRPILVILGNPPYNAFAGVSPTEERGLVEPYKEGLISEWGIKKFNLDDLYIRFFRLAERRIVDNTGKGVICYISNFSYLGDPSFVIMRKRFLSGFDTLWFDCMNGDSRETGKLTPDGKPDPSVFSTDQNREGIRVGTAIALMVRKHRRNKQPAIHFRHFWGVTKRSDLLESLKFKSFEGQFDVCKPDKSNRYTFRPSAVVGSYLKWPKLIDLCLELPLQGMDEDRGNALIESKQDKLEVRMKKYFDAGISWEEFAALGTGLSRKSAAFEPQNVRMKAQKEDKFNVVNIRRYLFRPCDSRFCYHTSVPNVWKRSRPDLWKQSSSGNTFLLSRAVGVAEPEGVPLLFASTLLARDCMKGHAIAFPILISSTSRKKIKRKLAQNHLFDAVHSLDTVLKANLSLSARAYLSTLSIKFPDADRKTAELIWMHALAIGYSPEYLSENADGIRQDWPRVPLPDSKKALLASADLGRQVAGLLDTENSVSGVTSGNLRSELKAVGVISSSQGRLDPEVGDLALSAGWGHSGKGGVVMPGKGKVEVRDYTPEELSAIKEGAKVLGLTAKQALEHLGETTCDIYLNGKAYWKNIPAKVWNYHIGGYQVIKKWLSYRERGLLGRDLTPDEVRYVMEVARRIAAILLLEPELDDNYKSCKDKSYPWNEKKS